MPLRSPLPFARRALVPWLLGTLLVAPSAGAVAQNAEPVFEVATVKEAPGADPRTGTWSFPGIGRFTASHVSLALLLHLAYGIDDSQIANKPEWLETSLYDINAKPEQGVALSREELKPRLQGLLRQRFHLVAHTELRPSRGYALVAAPGGPHLLPTKAAHFPGWRINVSSGQMRGENWTMAQLAQNLTSAAGIPVVDRTGVPGSYDISFSYEPASDADGTLPVLGAALKQATGLLLKPEKVMVETLVIESVDRTPIAN